MAGDWIKIQKATPGKPEVLRLARLLNVSIDDALGKCVRFWSWAEDNTTDGSVTHIELQSIDDFMRCPGWCSAMIDSGWLKYNAEKLVLSIPNWVRHNGNSSKIRALANARQVTHRSHNSHATSVTKALPEKRREDLSTKNDSSVLGTVEARTQPKPESFSKKVKTEKHEPEPAPEHSAQSWATTAEGKLNTKGIEAKARELGVSAKPGESYLDLKNLCLAKMRETLRGDDILPRAELAQRAHDLANKLRGAPPAKSHDDIEAERSRQLEAVRKATAGNQKQALTNASKTPNPTPHTPKKNGAETILEPWEANDVSIMAKALELDIDIPQGATFAKVRELCRLRLARLAHQSNL